jgi:hydroxyethylthiazole kinase-like uncharacterized protein yjeF
MDKRKKRSYKGQNGKVLVIAGSLDYFGAVYLASMAIACLRLGTDLVTIACPEKIAWTINSLNPDLITIKLKGDYINSKHLKIINELIQKNDILLIGPGISKNKNTLNFIKKIIKTDKPKVIDADAISATNINIIKNSIITCHKNEFKDLIKNSKLDNIFMLNKINKFNINNINIKILQKKLKNNIVLLKGKEDKIISKNKIKINKTGNEGMTVGGTGDILAGLVTGYLSQKNNLFISAYNASKLNGKIGDKLKKELGYGFIASDFLKIIAKESKKIK